MIPSGSAVPPATLIQHRMENMANPNATASSSGTESGDDEHQNNTLNNGIKTMA